MSNPMTKPRILIVEDNDRVGRALKGAIEQSFNCKVCFPIGVEAIRGALLFETFDSVLIDAYLVNLVPPIRLFDKLVSDGIEFARFYRELHEKCVIAIFGPDHLPRQPEVKRRLSRLAALNIKVIDSPLPVGLQKIKETLKVLEPTIEETAVFHQENPIFQPVDIYKGLSRTEKRRQKRLLYRTACQQTAGLVNLNLKAVGDCSWTVLCGGNFQKDYYGELLNGHKTPSFKVKIWKRYPRPKEFEEIADAKRTNPFIFWNTRDIDILSKQFSDQHLPKDSTHLQEDFSISVAPLCAAAYNEGRSKEILEWCKKLEPFGQFEITKEIFKSLNGDREKSIRTFSRRCEKARINRIVDIYEARVDQIIEKDNTAVVELTNSSGEENFAAPFDLQILKDHGVEEEEQKFEYTVYVDALDSTGWNIELKE